MDFMKEAASLARENAINNFNGGGPFGAVVVKDGTVIGRGKNSVLKDHDPSAHAEVNAIRDACNTLQTHDLTGCTLYSSCYPCPMCLSLAVWANIKEIYYGNTKEDAASIGFRDDFIYDILKNMLSQSELKLINLGREETIKTFEDFETNNNKIMY